MLAAYQLYRTTGNCLLISGGKASRGNPQNMPLIAPVIKRELVALGVPAKAVSLENQSTNTWQNLKCLDVAAGRLDFRSVTIISNRYHMPRIKAMIKYAPGLQRLRRLGKISFRTAEATLIKSYPRRWQPLVRLVYASLAMTQLLRQEQNGVRDIKAGRYQFQ